MTQSTARALRFTLLGIAVVLLLVNVAGMAGWMPKVTPPRNLNIGVMILVIASAAIRRRARTPDGPPPA